jgi:phosphonate transport system substrate-binding protein
MRKAFYSILTSAIFGLVVSSAANAGACKITVGVVPQFQQRAILEKWIPFLTELGQQTQCEYTLVGSLDIPEFEKQFKAGLFDLVYLNPYHSVIANETQGYVQIVRSGSKMLQGILVVDKDSGIKSIDELDGRQVAFPSPNALGASLLMRTELAVQHNVHVVPKYVATHNSVYLHLFKKITVAGGGIQRSLSGENPIISDQLKVLYRTQKVNAHPIAVHPRIDPIFRTKIQDTILEISQTSPKLMAGIPMHNAIATSFEDYKSLSDLGLDRFAAQ